MLGAVRLAQVEEAQQGVVRTIRQLEEQGQIMVRRGNDDEFVDLSPAWSAGRRRARRPAWPPPSCAPACGPDWVAPVCSATSRPSRPCPRSPRAPARPPTPRGTPSAGPRAAARPTRPPAWPPSRTSSGSPPPRPAARPSTAPRSPRSSRRPPAWTRPCPSCPTRLPGRHRSWPSSSPASWSAASWPSPRTQRRRRTPRARRAARPQRAARPPAPVGRPGRRRVRASPTRASWSSSDPSLAPTDAVVEAEGHGSTAHRHRPRPPAGGPVMSVLTPVLRERALDAVRPLQLGRVAELLGLHLLVTGLPAAVGDLVEVAGPAPVLAEVAASGPRRPDLPAARPPRRPPRRRRRPPHRRPAADPRRRRPARPRPRRPRPAGRRRPAARGSGRGGRRQRRRRTRSSRPRVDQPLASACGRSTRWSRAAAASASASSPAPASASRACCR